MKSLPGRFASFPRALAPVAHAMALLLLLWLLPQEPRVAAALGEASSSLRHSPKLDYSVLRFQPLQRGFSMEAFEYRTSSGAVLRAPAAGFFDLRRQGDAWTVGTLRLRAPHLDLSGLKPSAPGKGGGGGGPKVEGLEFQDWTLSFKSDDLEASAFGPLLEFKKPANAPWTLALDGASLDFKAGSKLASALPGSLGALSGRLWLQVSGQDRSVTLTTLRLQAPQGDLRCQGQVAQDDDLKLSLSCTSADHFDLGDLSLSKAQLRGLSLVGLDLKVAGEALDLTLSDLGLGQVTVFGRRLLADARLSGHLERKGEDLSADGLRIDAPGLRVRELAFALGKGAFGLPNWKGSLRLEELRPAALGLSGLAGVDRLWGQTRFSGGLPRPLLLNLSACQFQAEANGAQASMSCPKGGLSVPVDRPPSLESSASAATLRWGDLALKLPGGDAQ